MFEGCFVVFLGGGVLGGWGLVWWFVFFWGGEGGYGNEGERKEAEGERENIPYQQGYR